MCAHWLYVTASMHFWCCVIACTRTCACLDRVNERLYLTQCTDDPTSVRQGVWLEGVSSDNPATASLVHHSTHTHTHTHTHTRGADWTEVDGGIVLAKWLLHMSSPKKADIQMSPEAVEALLCNTGNRSPLFQYYFEVLRENRGCETHYVLQINFQTKKGMALRFHPLLSLSFIFIGYLR